MAVHPARQGRVVGRKLIEAAALHARARRRTVLVVATAAADIGNLRFYQRTGFRMRSIDRDDVHRRDRLRTRAGSDGIDLPRPRVWLDRPLTD